MKRNEMKYFRLTFIVCCFLSWTALLYAHSGGTDSRGGHRDRRTGSYHYHGSGSGSGSGSRIGFVGIGQSWGMIATGANSSSSKTEKAKVRGHLDEPQRDATYWNERSSEQQWREAVEQAGRERAAALNRGFSFQPDKNIAPWEKQQRQLEKATPLGIRQGGFMPGISLKVMFFLIWTLWEWGLQVN